VNDLKPLITQVRSRKFAVQARAIGCANE